jgi:hypothetical protein
MVKYEYSIAKYKYSIAKYEYSIATYEHTKLRIRNKDFRFSKNV